MSKTQKPYGFDVNHLDMLTVALAMEQEQRLTFLLEETEDLTRDDLVGVLSEFIGMAKSVEANALDQLRFVLMTDGKMYEREAEQVNIPSLLGALNGCRHALIPSPGMCGSCAFRRGSIPNQCLPTQEDVVYTRGNNANFMCHERMDEDGPTHLCAGFAVFAGRGKCG